MRKIGLYIVIAMAIVGMLMSGCTQQVTEPEIPQPEVPEPEAPAKPIIIGFTADLTGAYAPMGTVQRDTALLLIDEINKNGGIAGHPIEYIIYDTETDPVKGVIATKRLITEDKVHALLGSTSTGITVPVGLTAGEYGIAHIAQSGSPAFFVQIQEAGEEAFRWNFSITVPRFEEYIAVYCIGIRLSGTKIALVYPETAWGNSMKGAFTQAFPQCGLDIVVEISHPADATTFGPQIAALKANPDIEVVVPIGVEVSSGLFVAAMRDAGIKLPVFLITNATTTPAILELEKIRDAYLTEPVPYFFALAPDVWETLPDDDPRKPACAEWNALHEKFYGTKLGSSFEAYAYHSMWFWKDVFGRLLEDQPDILDEDLATIRAAVRDYIEATKNYAGILVLSYTPEDHGGVLPGAYGMVGKFSYPPPCEYIPDTEATTPPWREK